MIRKTLYAVLATLFCLSIPAAVRALHNDAAVKALYCEKNDNSICRLYQICKPILDEYPDSEITEAGKDCTLTIEARQIIIRRKRTAGDTGYFFYLNRQDARNSGAHP